MDASPTFGSSYSPTPSFYTSIVGGLTIKELAVHVLEISPSQTGGAGYTVAGIVNLDLAKSLFGASTLILEVTHAKPAKEHHWYSAYSAAHKRGKAPDPDVKRSERIWTHPEGTRKIQELPAGLHRHKFRMEGVQIECAGQTYGLRARLERKPFEATDAVGPITLLRYKEDGFGG
ncbi:hypothetical protein HDU89_003252 [Geranomyces variabilis]|nr:hypothetical protein HDU89_003252 [Geranomyces variabilis]